MGLKAPLEDHVLSSLDPSSAGLKLFWMMSLSDCIKPIPVLTGPPVELPQTPPQEHSL